MKKEINWLLWIFVIFFILMMCSVLYLKSSPDDSSSQSSELPAQSAVTSASISKLAVQPTDLIEPSLPSTERETSALVKEWRPSTAFIVCFWTKTTDTEFVQPYYKQFGSGLVTFVDGTSTIITNRHVVDSEQFGLPQRCVMAFPGEEAVFYLLTLRNDRADASHPLGEIRFLSDGSDVAFLSNFQEQALGQAQPVRTLSSRARSGSFWCSETPDTGDPLVVIGFPTYGSESGSYTALSVDDITVTEGIISGKSGDYLTTSAKIEHGNSGGLAIDKKRDCYIGIPTAVVEGSLESLGRIFPAQNFLAFHQ